MTHTTGVRILAARAVMTSCCLDCFPTRKCLEQLAEQRRLPHVGSKSTNTDYNWTAHKLTIFFTQRRKEEKGCQRLTLRPCVFFFAPLRESSFIHRPIGGACPAEYSARSLSKLLGRLYKDCTELP